MARQRRRDTVMSKHGVSNWREDIRAECLVRVQQQRSTLLKKLRERVATPESVKASIAGIIADVTTTQDCEIISPGIRGPQFDPQQLIEDDFEALMEEMRDVLFEDSEWAEVRRVEDAETEAICAQFQEHCQAASQLQAVGGATAQEKVLCPVCQCAYLVELFGSVSCPKEGFHIEVPMPGSQANCLSYVRDRISDVLQQHRTTACQQTPLFFVSDQYTGIWTLFVACKGCNSLAAVL